MLLMLAAALAAQPVPPLEAAIREAIEDEIDHGIDATKDKNIDAYMETVPVDYRIVETDGSITDRETLRAKQLQAWAIIPRTNSLEIDVERLTVGCEGRCATVWTDQRWDRQMMGRDGKSEHNVVTTQKHEEQWERRGSRWMQIGIKELGGVILVDGKPL